MADSLLLSDEERRRFVVWLRFEAQTANGMVETMKKIDIPEVVLRREASYAAACTIVAARIEAIEAFTVAAPGRATPTEEKENG